MAKQFLKLLLRGSTIILFLPLDIMFAQWQTGGEAICTAMNDQYNTRVLSDGNGGAYLLWQDGRNSNSSPMYAQHINNNGVTQWTNNGIPLSTLGSQIFRDVIGTNDGFILAWLDSRGMLLQRYDASGSEAWQPNGVLVVNNNAGKQGPTICPNGQGGCFAIWADWINGQFADVYAQKFSSSGTPEWDTNGVCVRTGPYYQYRARAVNDGAGGIFVVWVNDSGLYDYSQTNLHVQRVDANGNLMWSDSGKVICNAPKKQMDYKVIGINNNAFVAWEDYRSGNQWPQIYAQRIDGNGNVIWGTNGLYIANTPSKLGGIVNDKNGGIFIIYTYNNDLYSTHVDANGNIVWTKLVCGSPGGQAGASVDADKDGGFVAAWTDTRNDMGDIYAQRMNKDGNLLWDPSGVALGKWNDQQRYVSACYDGNGGIIGAWEDQRQASQTLKDIFANRVNGPPIPVELLSLEGKQFNNYIKLTWQTATETNNAGFYIERKINNEWETITFIKGNGTTNYRNEYEFIDRSLINNTDYISVIDYLLKQIDFDGTYSYSPEVFIRFENFYSCVTLYQNYPNPVNSKTTISFSNNIRQRVRLRVYDVLGKLINEIADEDFDAGDYSLDFEASKLPTGNYIYRIETANTIQQKMMTIINNEISTQRKE